MDKTEIYAFIGLTTSFLLHEINSYFAGVDRNERQSLDNQRIAELKALLSTANSLAECRDAECTRSDAETLRLIADSFETLANKIED